MEQKESRGHYSFMILLTANYKQLNVACSFTIMATVDVVYMYTIIRCNICTVTALYLFLFFPFHDCCITALTSLLDFTNIPQ